MKQKKLSPVHPGEVLLEEFLKPLAISQYRLAKDISVPPRRVNEIVLRKRSVSADTALRLSRFFGTSAEFWLNLQSQFDLDVESDRLDGRLEAEVVKFAPRVISSAVAEKMSALMTEEHLAARAKRASRRKFEAALTKVPDVERNASDRGTPAPRRTRRKKAG